jgi:Copper chaperone
MEAGRRIQFKAEMSCDGCSGAITRILSKIAGVSNIDCSLPDQTVTITAADNVDPQAVLQKLTTWGEAAGKAVSLVA